MNRDECDEVGMYAVGVNDNDDDGDEVLAARLERHVQDNIGLNPKDADEQVRIQIERWKVLYDEKEHIRLQDAVMNHIAAGYITYQENKFGL